MHYFDDLLTGKKKIRLRDEDGDALTSLLYKVRVVLSPVIKDLDTDKRTSRLQKIIAQLKQEETIGLRETQKKVTLDTQNTGKPENAATHVERLTRPQKSQIRSRV